jgi:glucose/arabinose dehydrogenase
MNTSRGHAAFFVFASAIASIVIVGGAQGQRGAQPGAAPAALAPPGINWPAPPLPDGPILLESAEVRSLRLVVMSKTLNQPWSIAFLPDGAILVTERPGTLRIFRNGVLDPNPVAGVPAVRAAGLQGLMDVVLHPRFAENKWIYLSYHKPVGTPVAPARGRGGPVAPEGATTIARGTWDGRALTNVKDIFESGTTNTESSRMVFGRDGMLYMTISAPGTGPQVVRSQDPNDYAGKTVRLRDDGSIPPDNPFVGKAGYKPGIFTVGHRNGHSFVVNPETGELWATEQGPDGGDEINIIKAGKNYGWPDVSYAHLGESLEGRHRTTDRVLGAVDRRDRDDLLHGRSLPAVEAERLCRRPAPGRGSAHRSDQPDRVQRQVGRDPSRADAHVPGPADSRYPRRTGRIALYRNQRESWRAPPARAG